MTTPKQVSYLKNLVHTRFPTCSVPKDPIKDGATVSDNDGSVTCVECIVRRIMSLRIAIDLWENRLIAVREMHKATLED